MPTYNTLPKPSTAFKGHYYDKLVEDLILDDKRNVPFMDTSALFANLQSSTGGRPNYSANKTSATTSSTKSSIAKSPRAHSPSSFRASNSFTESLAQETGRRLTRQRSLE